MNKAVAIVSGGLDSVVLSTFLKHEGYDVTMLSFNYGQRHKKELAFAGMTADRLGFEHHVIDLSSLTGLISKSALTAPRMEDDPWIHNRPRSDADEALYGDPNKLSIEVPEGHYAEETMKATVVPNRNMIMLSIAGGVAVNEGADFVAIGVHGGDHFIYPDCRAEFMATAATAIEYGNLGFGNFQSSKDLSSADLVNGKYGPIWAPYICADKTFIAKQGMALNVPFELTWSCYKGGDYHCGRCGTCVERLEAIHDAGAASYDKTIYEDTEFWKNATKDNV